MVDYTEALIWYGSWPVVIYLAYRFVVVNLEHFKKMEKLEELEAKESKKA